MTRCSLLAKHEVCWLTEQSDTTKQEPWQRIREQTCTFTSTIGNLQRWCLHSRQYLSTEGSTSVQLTWVVINGCLNILRFNIFLTFPFIYLKASASGKSYCSSLAWQIATTTYWNLNGNTFNVAINFIYVALEELRTAPIDKGCAVVNSFKHLKTVFKGWRSRN